MTTTRLVPSIALLALLAAAPAAAQSVLVEAKTTAGDEVATIRTDSMRLLVPLHLLLGGFEARYVAVDDSLRVRGEGSFLATGAFQSGTTVPPPASGAGTRMMWYPEKAAFRAGYVSGNEWDAGNVGYYSAAFGAGTTASGGGSATFGENTTASGAFAVATGSFTTAAGMGSTASGYTAQAIGAYSAASGYYASASGDYSTAFGANASASGEASVAFGNAAAATGDRSMAVGEATTASGYGAIAFGLNTTASGGLSAALGYTTVAQAYGSLVIGQYNVVEGTPTSWAGSDPLFVAGSGTSTTVRSNALTLYKNGNLTIAGTLTQSSDARLKEDMEPLEGTLERVLRLTPIRYHFRAGTGRPEGAQLGLTAQQVAPLFPELVKQDGDGYLSLSYANLSAVLVKALQEQQAEIQPLKAQIRALKGEIEELRRLRESSEAHVARLETLVEKLVAAAAMSHRDSTDPQNPR
ncbi:MAG: tail fiber domain-containing protein [Gemmatimonadota bacterium]